MICRGPFLQQSAKQLMLHRTEHTLHVHETEKAQITFSGESMCWLWECVRALWAFTVRKVDKWQMGPLGTSVYYFLQLHWSLQRSQNTKFKISQSHFPCHLCEAPDCKVVMQTQRKHHKKKQDAYSRCGVKKTISLWELQRGSEFQHR